MGPYQIRTSGGLIELKDPSNYDIATSSLLHTTTVGPLNITSTIFGAGGGTGVLTYHLPSFHLACSSVLVIFRGPTVVHSNHLPGCLLTLAFFAKAHFLGLPSSGHLSHWRPESLFYHPLHPKYGYLLL